MKIIAVIPAFNEEKNIGKVVLGVDKFVQEIIVVDDASTDRTKEIAQKSGAVVFSHLINRGLGGALGTGLEVALRKKADIIITIDGDCQHDPKEIPMIIKPIEDNEVDVVIGSRFLKKQKMPLFRKTGNHFFNIITFFLFGIKCTDTQSGFRAFNRKAAEKINISTNGMEVSSEIIQEIEINRLRFKEMPIKAIYTDYSLSKGQGFFMGLKTLLKLLILKLIK